MIRHFFRLNLAGVGYSLLHGTRAQGFEEAPLDVPSAEVGSTFFAVQRRLDHATHSLGLACSAAFACEPPGMPLAAYGISVNAQDDKGRYGLIYIHAIEIPSLQLPAAAAAITRQLSPIRLHALTQRIGALALDAAPTHDLLLEAATFLESSIVEFDSPLRTTNAIDPAVVVHDCLGAAGIAWIRLATRQSSALNQRWEIYDTVRNDLGLVSTAGGDAAGDARLASTLLPRVFADNVALPIAMTRAAIGEHNVDMSPKSNPSGSRSTHAAIGSRDEPHRSEGAGRMFQTTLPPRPPIPGAGSQPAGGFLDRWRSRRRDKRAEQELVLLRSELHELTRRLVTIQRRIDDRLKDL